MKVQTWKIGRVKPYPGNPRRNGDGVQSVARSIEEFGWRQPIVVDEAGVIIVGHTRFRAAQSLGLKQVPVHVATDLEPDKVRAYRIADNRTHDNSEWDEGLLVAELAKLAESGYDLERTAFTSSELEDMLRAATEGDPAEVTEDEYDPEPPAKPKSVPGEVYELGPHRLMCGDSTDPDHVARLLDGVESAPMLHADPPYGMGKEADGVENDNLYNDKLDAFQMSWWEAWRPYLADNGSAYIWGNPEPLWRLWFRHLEPSEELAFRNEIVWDKGSGFGQTSAELRSYAVNTERCFFFMVGRQFFGNVNKDDFFEGFERIRAHLLAEAEKMEWGPRDVRELTGVQMWGHWFSKSQWAMIPEKHYRTLQDAAGGRAFVEPYAEVREWYRQAVEGGDHPVQSFNEARAFFDNTHDNMNEVWTFPRVTGEDRHGHATPKPVALCARMVRSSAPSAGAVLEPFGGSGTTLIAAEQTGRVAYTMEIDAGYCDVIRRRYAAFVGRADLTP